MLGNGDCSDSRILVSIIILTKNGETYFRQLLEGLYCQTGIDRAEVIIIDSGSSDNTLGIAADFPEARLIEIHPSEFGHGRTRNFGAAKARGEFLVFLPQDATPVGSDWLADLLQPFSEPRVAGVFARQIARADASPMEAFSLARIYHDHAETKILAQGEAVSFSRCFFSTVGAAVRAGTLAKFPFREDVIMSEDQAWACEVMCEGYAIVYQPGAAVLHSHHYGMADVFRRNFDSGYSIWQIYSRKTGIATTAVFSDLIDEWRFVKVNGHLSDWLWFLPYELARHAGFWLGLHGDKLPRRVCALCSKLGYFWSPPELPVEPIR